MTPDFTDPQVRRMWSEYDMLAADCARRGLLPMWGDILPALIGADTLALIEADLESFQKEVRLHKYALAMEAIERKYA